MGRCKKKRRWAHIYRRHAPPIVKGFACTSNQIKPLHLGPCVFLSSEFFTVLCSKAKCIQKYRTTAIHLGGDCEPFRSFSGSVGSVEDFFSKDLVRLFVCFARGSRSRETENQLRLRLFSR